MHAPSEVTSPPRVILPLPTTVMRSAHQLRCPGRAPSRTATWLWLVCIAPSIQSKQSQRGTCPGDVSYPSGPRCVDYRPLVKAGHPCTLPLEPQCRQGARADAATPRFARCHSPLPPTLLLHSTETDAGTPARLLFSFFTPPSDHCHRPSPSTLFLHSTETAAATLPRLSFVLLWTEPLRPHQPPLASHSLCALHQAVAPAPTPRRLPFLLWTGPSRCGRTKPPSSPILFVHCTETLLLLPPPLA